MGDHCPLLKKKCIEHACKFYVHLLGNDPQVADKVIDKFDCAIAFLPILLIEGAQQTRQAGSAMTSFRNEMVAAANRALATGPRVERVGQEIDNPNG